MRVRNGIEGGGRVRWNGKKEKWESVSDDERREGEWSVLRGRAGEEAGRVCRVSGERTEWSESEREVGRKGKGRLIEGGGSYMEWLWEKTLEER